ncbi:MAG: efflux RND transporter permease subunit [Phycisphaerae bacterium]
MLRKIIQICAANRAVVLITSSLLFILAAYAALHSKLDAVPDLSDVQVLILTNDQGQPPQVIEQQITYPLETALISVPRVTAIRGESMFDYSLIHVVFKSGTNLYWARARILEYLNYARNLLPPNVHPELGPDATGVGWAYQYVLFPGWYCKHHPAGIWHDPKTHAWYVHRRDDAAAVRGGYLDELKLVRGFTHPGFSPISGRPLIPAHMNLGQLRALQDWFVRFQLESVRGVAEVAPLGGFGQEFQVVLDPVKMRAYHLRLSRIVRDIRAANNAVGGGITEVGEFQYMVSSVSYITRLRQLGEVLVGRGAKGMPIYLRNVAHLQIAGEQRQGLCEYNGRGEAVGGIVIVRYHGDAYRTIIRVKNKIASIAASLPPGILIRTGYNRDNLINRAIRTLSDTLTEEMIVVALVCVLFLLHARSSLVAIIVIPCSMIASLAVLDLLGVSANIMSLSGIAIAIGVVVDSAIVMVENAHQHLVREDARVAAGQARRSHAEIILSAAGEVGPSIFMSLLIITISFTPIFILPGESGKMFAPLALTKTFAMAAAAVLSITLVPVLMIYLVKPRLFSLQCPRWIRWGLSILIVIVPAVVLWQLNSGNGIFGRYRAVISIAWMVLAGMLVLPQKIVDESHNPVNRMLRGVFSPVFRAAIALRWFLLPLTLVAVVSIWFPLSHLGTQFTPPLDEGDLEYMPTTYPGISVTQARLILQRTDRIIKSFPEVRSVFGQMGRAITATDDAPLNMVDTIIRLKPENQWPHVAVHRFYDGWPRWVAHPFAATFWPRTEPITRHQLLYGWTGPSGRHHPGMNQALNFPGLPVYWTQPVENRTNMVNSGSRTLIGIRVSGPDLKTLSQVANRIAAAVSRVPGTANAEAGQTLGGYYLHIHIRRRAAARYGLTIADVQRVIRFGVGGESIATVIDGDQRFPINLRYFRSLRQTRTAIAELPVRTPGGGSIPLGEVASIRYSQGPAEIDSYDTGIVNYINITATARNVVGYVRRAKAVIARDVRLPPGYTYRWIGIFRQIQRTNRRLVPAAVIALLLIIIILFLATGHVLRVLGVLMAIPLGLIGAIWAVYLMHFELSAAVWVGVIALAGLCVEMGLVLLVYLDIAVREAVEQNALHSREDLLRCVYNGTVRRIRPQTMTVCAALAALVPLLWASGTGAGIMRHLAVPMIGGLITSFLLELLVLPGLYYVVMGIALRDRFGAGPDSPPSSTQGVSAS